VERATTLSMKITSA